MSALVRGCLIRSRLLNMGMAGGGGSAYEAESETIFAAFTTPPNDTRKGVINDLVLALKTAGAWTALDYLHVYAANDTQAACVNWKNPGTTDATLVNSPTFTQDRGYTTNGSNNYVETNFNPSTFGGQYTQDSACFGVWILSNAQSDTSGTGWFDGTDGTTIRPRRGSDALDIRINQASGLTGSGGSVTSSIGLSVANRSASNAVQGYKNGSSSVTGTNVSTTLNNATFNLGRATASSFVAYQYAASFAGGSLDSTKQAAVYSALLAYMQAVGAA